MKARLAVVVALALAGCKGAKNDEHRDEDPHPEAAEHDDHAQDRGEGEIVHVDPSMLRDLRVTTAPVEVRPAGEAVTALGEITVNEDRYVEISTPVAAQVTRVMAAAGAVVKAGQPLAELFSAELGKAKATLGAAQARVDLARRTLQRKKSLADEGVVAPKEAQEAQAALAEAEAQATSAMSELSAAGITSGEGSSRFLLKSPIAGTVIDRSVIVGRMSDPGQPLFRVGDLSRLWLVVQGFERDAVRIHTGSDAQVTLAALPGKTFSAKVAFIGARVDPVSRTIPIRLELDNADGVLRPGMSASAFIPVGDTDAKVTTVPTTALQRLDDGWYVFLPTAEAGAYERRSVGRGRTFGGEVEVVSGLKPTEKVVVEGAFLLKAEFEKARGGGAEHEH